jgi:hypothetical protein
MKRHHITVGGGGGTIRLVRPAADMSDASNPSQHPTTFPSPPGDFHFEINKRFQLFAAKIPYATEQGIFRVHPIHIPVYIQSTFPSIKRGLSIQAPDRAPTSDIRRGSTRVRRPRNVLHSDRFQICASGLMHCSIPVYKKGGWRPRLSVIPR